MIAFSGPPVQVEIIFKPVDEPDYISERVSFCAVRAEKTVREV